MRLPFDVWGKNLAISLKTFGYTTVRQTGAHLGLVSNLTGCEHRLTIPNRKPLRIGTLNSILTEVAVYLGKTKEELAALIFQ